MKQKALLAIVIAILLIMLLGCLPTPKHEAVVNKSDGLMEKRIKAQAVQEYAFEHDDSWQEQIQLQKVSILFDASIETPQTLKHPVLTVKKSSFTPDRVLSIVNALYPGNNMIRINDYSVDEIEFDMRMVQRGQYEDYNDETGEIIWAPYEDESEQMNYLANLLREAPQEDVFVPFSVESINMDGTQMVIKTETGKVLYLFAKPQMIRIGASRNGDIQPESLVWSTGGFAGETRHALDNVKITDQEIEIQTSEMLGRLDLNKDFSIASSEKARILEYIPEGFSVLSEGRLIELGRTAGVYLPYNYESYGTDNSLRIAGSDELQYAPKWDCDTIQFYMDENGLQSFAWYFPNEIVMTANENVELLSFAEVKQSIRDLLQYSYAWTDDAAAVSFHEIHVKKLILSCTIAQIPNQGKEAFLTPTWIVVYSNDRNESRHHKDSILLINAIDGSYIDRFIG